MKKGISGSVVVEIPVPESLKNDVRWELAQRVAASKGLASSILLSRFLLYVCDRQLRDRVTEITEHQIGVQVFGRPISYSPGDDNIVRNYARLLRKRLDDYFEGDGREETLRISIPRGGYVPVFHPNEPACDSLMPSSQEGSSLDMGDAESQPMLDVEQANSAEPPESATPSPLTNSGESVPWVRRVPRRYAWGAAIFLLALITSCFFLPPHFAATHTDSHLLWSQLFSKDKETFVVPADSGLVFLEDIAGHALTLKEYEKRQYLYNLPLPASIDEDTRNDLNSARYTSVTDLDLVSRLSRRPELVPDRFVIRYARDLHMDDLKHSNAVLIGSVYSNPWVELFESSLNFQFDYNSYANFDAIVNKHPRPGEAALFHNNSEGGSNKTYAVLAFLPNLDQSGKVLIIEGLTMAGTEAAEEMLFNEATMKPILEQAKASNASLRPFELLIEATGIAADAPSARVLASRYY